MSELSTDDIERLASRVAMMASEEGEAANAGRAVAQLARRLGLTGGELKELFLQGAMPTPGRPAPTPSPETERMERELGVLRKSVRLLEANYREVEYERDTMARALDTMRSQAANARSRSQIGLVLTGALALAVAGGAAVGWWVSASVHGRLQVPAPLASGGMVVPGNGQAAVNPTVSPEFGPVVRRVGVVRTRGAVARRQPDAASPAIATLQQGAAVVVRRLFTPQRPQWAEVEIGSSLGYVAAGEIDLN